MPDKDRIALLQKLAKQEGRTGFDAREELGKLQAQGQLQQFIQQPAQQAPKQTQRQQILSDIEAGKKVGKDFIGEGELGRIDTRFEEERSADVKDIIERREAALEGLSSEELQARRGQAKTQIDRQTETARRRLQAIQAQTGVRGGAAAAGISTILEQGLRTRADFERDLFLADVQAKRDALGAFEQSVTAVEATESQRRAANIQLEQFNLQQRAKERFGQLSTALGVAQLGVAERAADKSAEAAKEAANVKQSSGLLGGLLGGLGL